MSFTVAGTPLTKWTRLTDSTETTLFTADKPTTVVSVGWSETAGGTHTLLIVRDDGTNDHILRGAKALAAYERESVDEVLRLRTGDTIKATSSDADGKAHCRVTYLVPDASAQGRS